MSMDMIIQKASGASEWTISVGMKFMNTWFICGQIFVLVEMSIYIILFHYFHTHNVSIKKEKQGLGLSPDTIKGRKKQNVITLSGQSISFIVETVAVTIGQLIIFFHNTHNTQFPDGSLAASFILPFSAVLTGTFFVASPELRRFYFS